MTADHEARYRFACRFVRGKTVIDVACGISAGSRWLVEHGGAAHVTGIDIDQESVGYATQHFAHPQVEFRIGSLISPMHLVLAERGGVLRNDRARP